MNFKKNTEFSSTPNHKGVPMTLPSSPVTKGVPMTFMTNKEFSSEMIKERTFDYFNKGKTIDYLPPSRTQENYVFGTHGYRSGRIGWFEVK